MKWTHDIPKRNGWYWHRHVIGDIPDDTPIHCIIMRHPKKVRGRWTYIYDPHPSAYWNGQWRPVTEMPNGYRWFWSNVPIRLPKEAK